MADKAFNVYSWQNSPNTIRVTNNRIPNALENFYNMLTEYGHFTQNPTYKSNEYTTTLYDKNVRIPVSDNRTSNRGGVRPTISLNNVPRQYLDFWTANAGTNVDIFPACGTEIEMLEYKPRLLPRLDTLDFIGDFSEHYLGGSSPRPNRFWEITFKHGIVYPFGWECRYIGDETAFLNEFPGYYVCSGYDIYSGLAGAAQTKLYGLNRNKTNGQSAVTGTFTDTFIPTKLQKTGGLYDVVYRPYMRGIDALSFSGYIDSLSTLIENGFMWFGANFSIDSDIHFIFASAFDGNFTANPWANVLNGFGALVDMPYKQNVNATACSCIITTKAVWEDIFTGSGMPWSYDEDIVKSPDDGALTKPDEAGLPDNPTDDTPGSGDNTSDNVVYPTPQYVPNATVYDRYFLTPNQIPDVKTFLFSETFIDNIKRLWTNPAEYVISLCCYPFDVAATGLTTTETVLSIGGVSSSVNASALIDKGVPYFYGGSVYVDAYYGSYLDYEPYTSIDIYIPYIGVRPLNVSQVVGHRLTIGYYIDLNTQQITALIGLDGNAGNLGQVVTQFVGSIGVQTPLSGTSAQDMIRNVVTQTAGLITGVGAIAGGIASANPALFASGAAGVGNALLGGNTTAPSYYGSLSPVSGLYTPQTAYLIINRPRQALPSAYQNQQGFSSNYSGTVAAFTGYLECLSVNMPSADTMTDSEHDEIIALMKGGIYCG